MKLSDASESLQAVPADTPAFSVALACGFTPLHLKAFLAAHLNASITVGLFGDLAGTLERAADLEVDAVAVAVEWPDLDPRLGYRSLGGWGPAEQREFASTVNVALDRLLRAIERIPPAVCVAVSLPTLPLAPAFHTPTSQAAMDELLLRQAVANFAVEVSERPSVALVNEAHLLERSPAAARFDLRSELLTGFPYTVAHADAVAESLARLLRPQPVKKGLITDLDNTLWRGIVGEAGPEGVGWDLASPGRLHGLYQQVVRALAGQGVLIAVATKNQLAAVEQAFARPDLVLPRGCVFPIEAHWDLKSVSVGRILKTWNVGSDSVVFVDDDPMELAEVKAAWPQMECLEFPASGEAADYLAAEALFRRLRDLFGKPRIGDEDALRSTSIRGAVEVREHMEEPTESQDRFLREARAAVSIEFNPPASDARVLELVNKTNQFNLNGRRYSDAEWNKDRELPGAFVMTVAYQDRFGPLGKIAVLKGRNHGGGIEIDAWVMSCRAFSRRIEHRCLGVLFDCFGADEIRLNFAPTGKNAPLKEALARYLDERHVDEVAAGTFSISRRRFFDNAPLLFQRVEFVQNSVNAASMRSHA